MKPPQCRENVLHTDIWAVWQDQLHKQSNPELVHALSKRESELLPRFTYHYQRLQTLPRRWRRGAQRRLRLSLAGIALALALGQQAVLAATINVDGVTCNLINAINAANTDAATGGCPAGSGADTLVLPASSTITLATVDNYYYGPNGLPVINSEITIEGNGSTIQRSSAVGTPEFRLLSVSTSGELSLNNATISGGDVGNYYGGGASTTLGSLTLNNCTVSGNTASVGGGVSSSGSVHYVSNGSGGYYPVFIGSLTLNNSTISGNTAGRGGGVNSNTVALTLTNSTVTGNTALGSGGGMDSARSLLTFNNSTVSGNIAGINGGGVSSYGESSTFNNSTVSGNIAGRKGGGVDGDESRVTFNNSTVSGNAALGSGGGVYGYNFGVTFNNSTVSGNTALGEGGGVSTTYGHLNLSNSTVSGNSAGSGGGVVTSYSGLSLSRALISGNMAPTRAEISVFRSHITANDYNLFGDNSNTNATAFYYIDLDSTPGITFTPGITDITATSDGSHSTALDDILDTTLADNGGPTKTHNLVSGSPAIDASPADAACLPTDQRGVLRPFDGDGDSSAICDIGAVEFSATPLPILNINVPVNASAKGNLIDGDLASSWFNDGNRANAWFELVLDSPCDIELLKIAPRTQRAYRLDVYVDGNFIGQYTTTYTGTVALQEFTLPAGTHGTVVRIVDASHNGFKVHEVELWGGGGVTGVPVADANGPYEVTDTDSSGFQDVTLDGSGSTDTDGGTIVSWEWFENGVLLSNLLNPTLPFSVAGSPHTVSLTVTDDDGKTVTDSTTVTVNPGSSGCGPELVITDINVPVNASAKGNLIDGDLASSWFNDGNRANAWFELVLDSPCDIELLKIAPRTQRAYRLDVYVDGNFIGQYTTTYTGTVALQEFTLPAGTHGTVVRIVDASHNGFKVHEVKLQ